MKLSDTVQVSPLPFTLKDFISIVTHLCENEHSKKRCKSCSWKINISQIINDKGFLSLKESYEICSRGLVCSSWKAKTKLYQIPIATVGIGDLKKGNYQVFVYSKDSNLSLIKNLLTMKLQSETKMKSLDTHSVKAILDFRLQNPRQKERDLNLWL